MPAQRLRHGHAEEAGLGQRLDRVERVLLVAVDRRRARAHDVARKGAGALTQRDFVGGEAEVHGTYVIPGREQRGPDRAKTTTFQITLDGPAYGRPRNVYRQLTSR